MGVTSFASNCNGGGRVELSDIIKARLSDINCCKLSINVGPLYKSAFKLTRTFGKNTDLLTQKGIFPYEYLDSFDKFEETSLPPIESFYPKLNDESVSEG